MFAIVAVKRRENSARCRHHQKHQKFSSRETHQFPGEAAGQAGRTAVLPSDVILGSSISIEPGNGTRLDPCDARRTVVIFCARRLGRLTGTSSLTGTMSGMSGSVPIKLTRAPFPTPWLATPGIARSTTPRRQGDGGTRCVSLNGISLASIPSAAVRTLQPTRWARYWLGPYAGPSYLLLHYHDILPAQPYPNLRGGR